MYKTANVSINVTLRLVRVTIFAVQKQEVLHILSGVFSLSYTACKVACQALPYFSTLSHKRYDFRKKVIEHKMCVMIFPTTFV